MMLYRSLLLGSGAAFLLSAGAGAADLPTRKAAAVEYVKLCNVGGVTGWTLPGSDTCMKFSGYITGQFTGGTLATQYNWADTTVLAGIAGAPAVPFTQGLATQRVLVAASAAQQNTTFYRNQTG